MYQYRILLTPLLISIPFTLINTIPSGENRPEREGNEGKKFLKPS